MNDEQNPYAAPADTRHGKYDHSLFWRIVKCIWIGLFILAFLDIFVFACYQTTAQARDASLLEQVRSAFLGWDKH